MNFLAGLILGEVDDRIHSVMTRYGRGTFAGPAAEASESGKRLKIAGSYLYVPALGHLLADRCESDLSLQGNIVSKVDIAEEIEARGLQVLDAKKRGGYKYKVSGEVSPPQLHNLHDELYEAALLLKVKAKGFSLTTGSSVPKSNKFSDPSFSKLTIPSSEGARLAVVDALVPGVEPVDFESFSVSHTIQVTELVVPEEVSGQSASMMRLAARRRGILSRSLTVDGKTTEASFDFLA
jgi:hypothetical protein